MTTNSRLLTSIRFLLSCVLFLASIIQYTHKTDISVGILCMVNHTAIDKNTTNSSINIHFNNDEKCPFKNSSAEKNPDGPFLWSKEKQGVILSSFFAGYFIMQIPAGWIAFKFGGMNAILFSILLSSLGTLLVPLVSSNYYLLIICRFLTGVGQSTFWPGMWNWWGFWMPNSEKGSLISFIGSGGNIGVMIAFSLGGYLCIHGFDGGWPAIFYIFGGIGVFWCVFWYFLSSETPQKHKLISENEKIYIASETIGEKSEKPSTMRIWKLILKSRACWILFCQQFAGTFIISLFLTNAPTYFKEVLKFDVQTDGFLSSIPYGLLTFINIVSGIVSDKLIASRRYTKNTVRKFFTIASLIIPIFAIIGLSFVTCNNPYLAVGILTFGISIGGLNSGGYSVCFNDIAGVYGSLVYGISNSIAESTGVIVPYIVAELTENQTLAEWRLVFICTSAIMLIGSILTLIFGTTDTEPWAMQSSNKEIDDSESLNTYLINKNYNSINDD